MHTFRILKAYGFAIGKFVISFNKKDPFTELPFN